MIKERKESRKSLFRLDSMNKKTEKKKRLVLLDVLKIIFALFVFLRHSSTMGGCRYGNLNNEFLIPINNIIMSGFFILSGFSLFYTNNALNMHNMTTTFNFYKKRAIAIFPIYFLVIILHFILLENDLITNLQLLPIEITGIHAYFNNTFYLLHNGTTWFVSCILLAYFIYPYIQEIIKCFNYKKRIIIFIILLFFLTYFPFLFSWYKISETYANPLFRCFEFIFGMTLCSIINFNKNRKNQYIYMYLFIFLLIIESINIYYFVKITDNTKYTMLSLIIYFGALYSPNKKLKHKVINFLIQINYPFYIFQDLLWKKSKILNPFIQSFNSNIIRILSFFIVLLTISIASIYLYQIPISKLLKKSENIH